jgi:two-component system chemotaxis response regulator CheB
VTALVRTVVVEDSAVQRAHLVRVLEADGDIRVVGQAEHTNEAVDVIVAARPDVVMLDINIPGGGGQMVIERIMAVAPTPILVLSGAVGNGSSATVAQALGAGALEAMAKPARWSSSDERALRDRVRVLQGVIVVRHAGGHDRVRRRPRPVVQGRAVVAIAASTGGPQALATILSGLRPIDAPVLIVQHIQSDFVDGLAAWMRRVSEMPVAVARDGGDLAPGQVYLAPGGTHLRLAEQRRMELSPTPDGPHRPSADELFTSVAAHAGGRGIGVILTGMGADGARGLAALHRAGGRTISQDRETSVVFGMPGAAQAAGAVQEILPLDRIAPRLMRLCTELRA